MALRSWRNWFGLRCLLWAGGPGCPFGYEESGTSLWLVCALCNKRRLCVDAHRMEP